MGLDLCHAKPSSRTNDTLDYFSLDELNHCPDFINRYKHLLTEAEGGNGDKIQVLYFVSIGYQRKRMNKDFINNFENCKLYFDIDSVRLASRFLEAKPGEDQLELKQAFQKNFIDNFIEGESVFYASW